MAILITKLLFTIDQLFTPVFLDLGGNNQENYSNMANTNMSYSHSTPMNMMGPAAVSTLQRKPTDGINESTTNNRTMKPFEPHRIISDQIITTANVISDTTKSVSSNSTFIPPLNHLISSVTSDAFQNTSSDCKNTTTPSSTTSSTIESPKQSKKLKNLIFSGKNLKKILVSKHKETDSMTYQSGLTGKSDGNSNENSNSENTSKRNAAAMAQAAIDDRHRRKFFSHHDVSSLCASLGGIAHAARAKEALERRNTTTGASAASAALRSNHAVGNEGSSVNSSSDSPDVDHGDNVSNELVLR